MNPNNMTNKECEEFEAIVETGLKVDKLILEIDDLIPMLEHLRSDKKKELNMHITSLYSMLNRTKPVNKSE